MINLHVFFVQLVIFNYKFMKVSFVFHGNYFLNKYLKALNIWMQFNNLHFLFHVAIVLIHLYYCIALFIFNIWSGNFHLNALIIMKKLINFHRLILKKIIIRRYFTNYKHYLMIQFKNKMSLVYFNYVNIDF